MRRSQSRRFEAAGTRWIARLLEPAQDPSSSIESGIWFENAAGQHRFLKMDDRELRSGTEFRLLAGLELARMLKRAVKQ